VTDQDDGFFWMERGDFHANWRSGSRPALLEERSLWLELPSPGVDLQSSRWMRHSQPSSSSGLTSSGRRRRKETMELMSSCANRECVDWYRPFESRAGASGFEWTAAPTVAGTYVNVLRYTGDPCRRDSQMPQCNSNEAGSTCFRASTGMPLGTAGPRSPGPCSRCTNTVI